MWKWVCQKRNEKKKGTIPLLLLFLFFCAAAGMTVISQKNYERNLLSVAVMYPVRKSLQYTEEYLAVYKETQTGGVIQWEMDESAEYAKEGEVWVYPVHLENRVTETGKLVPYYIKGEGEQGQWIHAVKNSDTAVYTMEAGLGENFEKYAEAEFIMAEVYYKGMQREFVVPCSAIVSPKLPTESPRVYIIEEIPKVWGTAMQIQAVSVMILETNGIEAAIGNTISAELVIDGNVPNLSEGIQVKPFYPEEGGEENEEGKEEV